MRINVWQRGFLEMKGMRVNLSKTKLMVGGERHNTRKTVGKTPCAVCGKGVGLNSIQFTLSTMGKRWCVRDVVV